MNTNSKSKININTKNILSNSIHKNSFISTKENKIRASLGRNKSVGLFKSLTSFGISNNKRWINGEICEEEEGINKYVDYLNIPVPISIKPDNIPDYIKFYAEYDLFFCGKKSNIDCICCKDKICQPGNCMCLTCMKFNKKYHKLKSHYLINKAGRACKYSHGSFHCYSNFIHIINDIVNNVFKTKSRCHGHEVCKPCEEITILMEQYLPSSICQKLKDRELAHL